MKLSRSQIFRLTRDTRFLYRAALVIATASVSLGLLISLLTASRESPTAVPGADKEKLLPPGHPPLPEATANSEEAKALEDWATEIRRAANFIESPDLTEFLELPEFGPEFGQPLPGESEPPPVRKTLVDFETELAEDEALEDVERKLLVALAQGLLSPPESERGAAITSLREAAAQEPTPPRAHEFLGDVLSQAKDWDGAIDAYRAEVERDPEGTSWALERLIELLAREGRIDEIGMVPGLPDWVDFYTSFDRKRQAAKNRDYWGLFLLVLKYEFQHDAPSFVFLSFFAAGIWFLIVTRFSGEWRKKWALYLVSFVLGIFSATFTLYAVWLQNEILHFDHDPTAPVIDQVIYCIAGIGLREELIKLLLFLPLVPLFARRGNDIDALVCAGLVGLGFAFNENIGYLHRGGEFATWSRFLTANFLHVALTGIAGLSLVRCWRRPKRHWDHFLYDFLIVVAAHGAYDALLMVPQAGEYGLLSIVIFALIAYLFLDQATHLMPPATRLTVSPLSVFVLGAALLIGVVLCFACWGLPFFLAAKAYAVEVAGMVPVAFIFINRLREL